MSERKQTVLVIDDTPENIDVLSAVLRSEYKVRSATSGELGLKIVNSTNQPDLILLDIMMPHMDGHEVCRILKNNPLTAQIPVIFVTGKSEVVDEEAGFALGAVDFITKPVAPSIVLARVKTQLALYDQARHLEQLVEQRTEELNATRLVVIRRLGRAAEYKDNETGMHVIRMSWFSKFIAEELGMDPKWCELLYHAAPMHDIGKIGIPDNILLKPGKLDPDEWKIMKRHAEYGAKIIGDHSFPLFHMAKEIALYHHEKWDGSGYPQGLKGTDIPLTARIVAIADVFDALTSVRPYKQSWSEDDAINFIKAESGKHFDPDLVPKFLASLVKIRNIQTQYQEGVDIE